MVGLGDQAFLVLGVDAAPLAVDGEKLLAGGEVVECDFALGRAGDAGSVVEQEAVAVGADREGGIEHFGVVESLLHALTDGEAAAFGFDDGDGDVRVGVEHVVGALGAAGPVGIVLSHRKRAAHEHAPLGECHLLAEMALLPAGFRDRGGDALGADVPLAEGFLVTVTCHDASFGLARLHVLICGTLARAHFVPVFLKSGSCEPNCKRNGTLVVKGGRLHCLCLPAAMRPVWNRRAQERLIAWCRLVLNGVAVAKMAAVQ